MTKRMLIDATHAEETRVVVMDGNQLDDFDYESSSRRTLKGNIYLGKVVRVEPSLQAAFIDYGGNRHGFLPFSDIHPDYYRIPMADREALLSEEDAHPPAPVPEVPHDDDAVEEVGDTSDAAAEDEIDADRRRTERLRRAYKIQEVIKRRQILLIQVTKEERGNKGAALTTYVSLAGRYCVLMPNTTRGGGISRKITNTKDRRRLKDLLDQLALPEGMAIILRTAGVQRTKTEIKRDHDFLMKLWDDIRERTLSSRAPALIYEEANLVKRTIRDIYTRDIEEILVEGEEAYRTAKDFMRALMPSHARRVQLYKDKSVHLFSQNQVESQIEGLHSTTVRLRSGGSIVINSTEALVAIDVNSGRATRERHIEETAAKTNLEAAVEIARQLRLRDLAGLIVIDFIDMEDRRNNSAVERKLKDALRNDRARIQLGRISPLGLFEMSRQRLRPSLFDTSMQVCPICHGQGHVRSVESTALHVLRAIEEEAARGRSAEVAVYVPTEIALFILNQKRDALYDLEKEQGLRAVIERDDALTVETHRIEHLKQLHREPEPEADEEAPAPAVAPVKPAPAAQTAPADEPGPEDAPTGEEDDKPRRRRRGRRGGRRRAKRPDEETGLEASASDDQADDQPEGEPEEEPADHEAGTGELPEPAAVAEVASEPAIESAQADSTETPETPEAVAEAVAEAEPAPPKRRRTRRRKVETTEESPPAQEAEGSSEEKGEERPKPVRRRRPRKPAAATQADAENSAESDTTTAEPAMAGEALISDVPPPDAVVGQDMANAIQASDQRTEASPDPIDTQPVDPERETSPLFPDSAEQGSDAKPPEESRETGGPDTSIGNPANADDGTDDETGGSREESPHVAAMEDSDEDTAPAVPSRPEPEEDDDRPRRRGWWQRLLE